MEQNNLNVPITEVQSNRVILLWWSWLYPKYSVCWFPAYTGSIKIPKEELQCTRLLAYIWTGDDSWQHFESVYYHGFQRSSLTLNPFLQQGRTCGIRLEEWRVSVSLQARPLTTDIIPVSWTILQPSCIIQVFSIHNSLVIAHRAYLSSMNSLGGPRHCLMDVMMKRGMSPLVTTPCSTLGLECQSTPAKETKVPKTKRRLCKMGEQKIYLIFFSENCELVKDELWKRSLYLYGTHPC